MTLQKIEFEYDIPDGYRFVRYGKPKKGDGCLLYNKQILVAECNYDSDEIIVEKIPEQEQPTENSKRHKHADLIHAWAEGAEIQFQRKDKSWGDVVNNIPNWGHEEMYRIKPKTKTVRFRNWISCSGNIYVASESEQIGQDHKWLGDWQELEIEDND